MKTTLTNYAVALGCIALGITTGVVGIAVGEIDDAPGGAVLGVVLMIAAVAIGVRTARRKGQ